MNHRNAIQKSFIERKSHNEIARKIYLSYPTSALVGHEEKQFEIANEISNNFSVPIMAVQLSGSAKTGYSFHTGKEFSSENSDLDIAIIDPGLYQRYMEIVFIITEGYTLDVQVFCNRLILNEM